MAILPIVKYPDQRLKTETKEVSVFDGALKQLVDDMFATMYAADGIGLAAPQVGVDRKVVVIDVSRDGSQRLELINPHIVTQTGKKKSEEGCLSIPGYRDTIDRAEVVTINAYNAAGEEYTLEAGDLLAICLQHEIDHLNGILFIDHLSMLKKQMFQMWYKKNAPL